MNASRPNCRVKSGEVLAHAEASGYRVARLNHFFGKPLRRGGLYPDYSVRLFDRRLARFTDAAVHERVVVNGASGTLRHPMIHLAYESVRPIYCQGKPVLVAGRKGVCG